LNEYSNDLNLKVTVNNILKAAQSSLSILTQHSDDLTQLELYNESIKSFALLTSKKIEFYHKVAECLVLENEENTTLITKNDNRPYKLYQFTKLFINAVNLIADGYCKKCRASAKPDETVSTKSCYQFVTDIYLEASNSTHYIVDSFMLFLPIFKSFLNNN
jgi:hypothetical protein